MTKTIEKRRKRNPPRGILTPTEKERLRKGTISRQLANNIRRKTMQAIIVDLPLIFEKIGIQKLTEFTPSKQFLKKTLQLYFNSTKNQMMDERSQRGIKRKVSPEAVWKRILEEMGDT